MREIKKVIIHCSDSGWGDADIIDKWHKQRGWDGIGYHFVILNGYRNSWQEYNPEEDGLIENGRPIDTPGAHCRGHNMDSIGICLIGGHLFTAKQLYEAIPKIIKRIGAVRDIEVYGHYEFNAHKTCPNIDMDLLRKFLKNRRI